MSSWGRRVAWTLALGFGASAWAGDPSLRPPEVRIGPPNGSKPPNAIDARQELKKPLVVAESRLEAGRYRSAAAAFDEFLAKHPNNARGQFGLGRALVNLGRCEDGAVWLELARGRVEWTPDTGLAEARCAARTGDLAGAERIYRDVLDEHPNLLLGWYELGQLGIRADDEALRVECSAMLATLDGGERMALMLDAWGAVPHDADAAWAALDALRRSLVEDPARNVEVQALLIEGLLWLDVDEVDVAVAVLSDALASTPKHVRARVYLAEALRRQGATDLAKAHLLDPFVAGPDAPIAAPFLARIAVDQGDYAGAQAALEAYPWRGDGDWTASRAYLAAASGAPDAAAWADAWARTRPPADRTLAQLRPVGR